MKTKMAIPLVKDGTKTPIVSRPTRADIYRIKGLLQAYKTFETILVLLAFILLIVSGGTTLANMTKQLLIAAAMGAIVCYSVVCLVFSLIFTKYPIMKLFNLCFGVVFLYLAGDAIAADWDSDLDDQFDIYDYKHSVYTWAIIVNAVLFLTESIAMHAISCDLRTPTKRVPINNNSA